jgi:hypothetical protein
VFGEAPEHRRASELELCGPSWVVDRDDEFATSNEMGMHLASDVRTHDVLPAARDPAQNEGVLQPPLAQQSAHRGADEHGLTNLVMLLELSPRT